MRKLLLALCAACALSVCAQAPLSETKYDWSQLATSITANAQKPLDKHYAIYRWLCDNIAYDTSYSIYTADECYEQRRGVCQAYSELYCRLAEAVGLRADLVVGKSKSEEGIDDMGHAWIFAYTDGSKGILVDATWGAGSVDKGKFTHIPGNDTWFNVSPQWMIFSHWPDDSDYQLMADKLTFEQFAALPNYRPGLAMFGFDGSAMLNDALSGRRADMPQCYPGAMTTHGVERIQIPKQSTLRVGEQYTVALKTDQPLDNVKSLGKASGAGNGGLWQRQGEYIVGRVTPCRAGDLSIGVKNDKGSYTTLVEYQVPSPTAQDIANLEAHSPHLSPLWETLGNFTDPEFMADHNVDLSTLLARVRAERIKAIPTLYSGVNYGIQDIPWNAELRVGQTYRIEFLPYEGEDAAVINEDAAGEADWLRNWSQDPQTRAWCIDVTPQRRGTLAVAIKKTGEKGYSYCFEYTVK